MINRVDHKLRLEWNLLGEKEREEDGCRRQMPESKCMPTYTYIYTRNSNNMVKDFFAAI